MNEQTIKEEINKHKLYVLIKCKKINEQIKKIVNYMYSCLD